ncbi:uncharacterized protein MONBRDRAFT_34803 [Monosiga brevicollis MX1]|uniref:Uncharacterized protein n=1 Tax=Monosiga brevicollis TaxID=81824 RepID=A9VE83_MONBE|nr:uncharacterized protein MONBRDRAFT_34803 [Monosiga brevicollis MX1]EDQ84155.1 predicted protein [Monosiga brevicollis MX1]|eukprot:XP_001751028.1 hypothetical protein [Monosiga brevicollis MX1]
MTAASHVLMDQITCHRLEQPNHVYVNAYFCIFVQEEAVNATLRESVLFGLSTVLLIQGTDTLLENLNINWALNSDGLPFALGFNTCNIMPGPSTNNTMMRNVKSLAQLGGYGLNISGTDTLVEDSVFGHFSDNVGLNMALAVYIHHISRNTLLQGSDRFALRLQATVGLETFGQNVTVRNATFNNNMYEPTTMIRVRGGSCQLANVLLVNYLPLGCSPTNPRSVYQNMSMSATAVSLRNVTNSSATGLIIPVTLGAAAGLKVEMSHNIKIENPHIVLSTTWTDKAVTVAPYQSGLVLDYKHRPGSDIYISNCELTFHPPQTSTTYIHATDTSTNVIIGVRVPQLLLSWSTTQGTVLCANASIGMLSEAKTMAVVAAWFADVGQGVVHASAESATSPAALIYDSIFTGHMDVAIRYQSAQPLRVYNDFATRLFSGTGRQQRAGTED